MRKALLALPLLGLFGCVPQAAMQPAQTVYVPAAVTSAPTAHIVVPPDPLAGLPEIVREHLYDRSTIRAGVTTLFAYSPDSQYTIECRPLFLTSIKLNPDEHVKKNGISIGDQTSWQVEATDQEVRVKPMAPLGAANMSTGLDIATDKRSYLLVVRSGARYMPNVRWYYPEELEAALEARTAALRAQAVQAANPPKPEQLYCGYRIEGEAAWKPSVVCSDTKHLYVGLTNAPGTDLPSLSVPNGKREEIVNYDTRGDWLITDRPLTSALLSSGVGAQRQLVRIEEAR
jgi:P-type conjugative transfer protein TrbG